MNIQNICVIGAGVSGLVTAKTLLEEGYEVMVFEKQVKVGGVWEKSRTYPEVSTQNTGNTYCFSDYPMPASFPEWPTAEDMRNYLESYARNFGLIDKIRFHTEVLEVSRQADTKSGWVVTVEAKDPHSQQIKKETYKFDFVVVCNGLLSTPKIPNLPGKEEFIASGGQVFHSTELNDAAILEGKRVVVIGYGKSACDIANLAAKTAKTCTLVFRRKTWKIPRFFLGFINMKHLLLTRYSEAWFPYMQLTGWEKTLHTLGRPLVWVFWRTLELILRLQLGLDRCGMLPEYPIERVNCDNSQAPSDFFPAIHSGKIKPVQATLSQFIPGGLELGNGQQLEADIVIFGTGFIQVLPFLEEKYRRLVLDEKGIIHLYRHLIHPEIPQMGFVGYQDSFYNTLTSEVGAWWLVDYIKGYLSLPSHEEMYESIAAELDWIENQFSSLYVAGACMTSFTLRHIEQLIKDMDINNQVVIWKGLSQVMKTVDLSMYHRIRQELKLQRPQTVEILEPENLSVR